MKINTAAFCDKYSSKMLTSHPFNSTNTRSYDLFFRVFAFMTAGRE